MSFVKTGKSPVLTPQAQQPPEPKAQPKEQAKPPEPKK